MKRNIFIRMVSLLLCFSMLTPIGASAFYSPLETTNEMRYVDQFFNDDGTFSETGEALLHWLDMTPKGEEDALREDSGYLTLEVEIDKRSDWKYATNKTVNTITGFPSVIAKWFAEDDYEELFPNSGSDAIIYYDTLQQIYTNYKQEVLAKIVEEELAWDTMLDVLGELVADSETLACMFNLKTSAFVVINRGLRVRGPAQYIHIDVYDTITVGDEQFFRTSPTQEVYDSAETITESCRLQGTPLVINNVATGKKHDEINDAISKEFRKHFDVNSRPNADSKGLTVGEIQDFAGGIEKSKGYNQLNDDEKKVFDNSSEKFSESTKKQKDAAIQKWKNDSKKIFDAAGVAVAALSYWNDYENMTLLQASYMDALFDVTEEYREMLTRWRNSVERDETISTYQALQYFDQMYGLAVGDANTPIDEAAYKSALLDALDAMRIKITAGYVETAAYIDKMIDAESAILTRQQKNEVYGSAFEFATGISLDLVEAVKDIALALIPKNSLTTTTATTGIKAAAAKVLSGALKVVGSPITLIVTCFYASAETGKRLEFADSATAISNLKWSLCGNILDLLAQYGQYGRNHETACSIIEALKTMAVAKHYGENLVREYYLDDLYDELGINPGSSLHTILWNELQTNSARKLPDIKEVTEPVIVVYEEDVRVVVDGDDKKITQVLGVFSKSAASQATFAGQPLSTIASEPRFSNLQSKDPNTYAGMDFNTWSEGWQPNGQNAKNRFKSQRAYLYSRNGLDLIITAEEYDKYLDIRDMLADLVERNDHNDPELSKSECLNADRLSWSWECQLWIESFEMYSAAVDYSKHKVEHGLVPN